MGKSEKLGALFIAAIISLGGILVALYQGTPREWGAVGDLLAELITSGGAGTAVYISTQRLKQWKPNLSSNFHFWFSMVLSLLLAPAAWLALVALSLTELSERGAIMAVGAAISTAKVIYQQHKEGAKKALERGAEAEAAKAKRRIRERLGIVGGTPVPLGDNPTARIRINRGETDYTNSGDAQPDYDYPGYQDGERGNVGKL
jgi:hypothetical protein